MKVSIPVIALFCAAGLSGCVSSRVAEQRREQEKKERDMRMAEFSDLIEAQKKQIHERYAVKDPTPEDVALTKERYVIYYNGLIRSIRMIDDGISPADSIARAAVNENLEHLRSWKRADTAHFARPSEETAQMVERALNDLPTRHFIDDATSLVLRIRAEARKSRESRLELL